MPTLSFGKHAGKDLQDVPEEYLQWLIQMRQKDLKEYQDELDRRALVEAGSLSMVEQIIREGFRSLSKKLHPDQGGSAAQFLELKSGEEQLKMVLRELQIAKGGGK